MKRVWMLLLAVIALVAVMTIPAMAAEETEAHTCLSGHCHECGSHDGWLPLTEATVLEPDKSYFLNCDDGVLNRSITFVNMQGVTICLNGQTWVGAYENGDTSKQLRPLGLTEYAEVTIVDCVDADKDGLSDGKMIGSDIIWRRVADDNSATNLNKSKGGTLYVVGYSTLTIYNGTFEGGVAHYGGNVYVSTATISVYGGRLQKGEAKYISSSNKTEGNGGNVCVDADGEFNLIGGTIAGGKAPLSGGGNSGKGPAVYLTKGTFNASNNAVITYDAEGTDFDSVGTNGGLITICSESAQFSATDTTIRGGTSSNAGGAIRSETAKSVTLTGCTLISGKQAAGGAAIFINNKSDVTLKNTRVQANSEIITNTAQGLIYVFNSNSKLTICENSTVDASGVSCGEGGAICVANGTLMVDNSTIIGGTVTGRGGAILAKAGSVASTITIQNDSTIIGGSATGGGGAVCINGAKVTFVANGSSFEGGASGDKGGVIRIDSAADPSGVTITDCEITAGTSCVENAPVCASGAAIYIATARPVRINGTTISAVEGYEGTHGLIYINSASANVTLENGTILNAKNVAVTKGAAVYLEKGTMTLNGSQIIGGATAAKEAEGGAIYMAGASNFNMRGNSTINGANAKFGGAVYMSSSGAFNMEGGSITGGNVMTSGGALYIASGTFNLYAGTISGGSAAYGGNVYLNGSGKSVCAFNAMPKEGQAAGTTRIVENGSARNTSTGAGNIRVRYASLTLEDTIVRGGTTKDGHGAANVLLVMHYDATIKGNTQIAGGFVALTGELTEAGPQAGGPLNLQGAPVIDKALTPAGRTVPTAGLHLKGGTTLTISELGAAADIKLTCENTTDAFSNAATDTATAEAWASCFTAEQAGYGISVNADNKLCLLELAGADGSATVGNGNVYYTMPAAIAKAGQNGLIHMQANYSGELTIPSGVWVDLNGKTLAGKVTVTGGDLYLIDSLSADYNLEQDKDGNFIYGKLTATVEGTVEDSFTTQNQNSYNGNHRYIVLVDTDKDGNKTYHAHRIYLAVKSTVLYPEAAHMQFRTHFKCDQVVANSAVYGLKISGKDVENKDVSYSIPYSKTIDFGGAENSRLAGLMNILGNNNAAHLATADYTVCGYIDIGSQHFESSTVTRSFKGLVQDIDTNWTGLNEAQQDALVKMFKDNATFMAEWKIDNIKENAG